MKSVKMCVIAFSFRLFSPIGKKNFPEGKVNTEATDFSNPVGQQWESECQKVMH